MSYREAATLLVDRLRTGTADGRTASIAFSGDQTPWSILEQLALADLAWSASTSTKSMRASFPSVTTAACTRRVDRLDHHRPRETRRSSPLIAGDLTIPAGRVDRDRALVLTDLHL